MNITITDKLEKEAGEFRTEHDMFKEMITQKSNFITKKLGVEPVDVELILVNSKGKISTFLITTQEIQFPIAYKEGTNQIMTIHPKMTGQLFQNHEEEYSKLIEYALLKMYLNKKYAQESQEGFFIKHCIELAAQVLSDKYLSKISEFEIKMYTPGKKIKKKEIEIGIFFYLLRENSGVDFIYQNLDTIFKEQDVKTSLHTIYKKNFDDFLLPLKEKLIEEQRKQLELQKKARQDQNRPVHKMNQRDNNNNNSGNRTNNLNKNKDGFNKNSNNKSSNQNRTNNFNKRDDKKVPPVDVDKL